MSTKERTTNDMRRRGLKAAMAGLAATALAALGVVPPVFAQGLPMPKSPVTINVVDVAGNLALTQDAMEEYAKKNPNLVAKFNF
jgi:putative spermidine/putrescine transport system substrate-binding protein